MKGTLVALGQWRGRDAAARLVDGRLDDLFVDPADTDLPLPGTIFRARPTRQVKGMGGVFVDLGEGQTGFLRQNKGVSMGRPLLVQVSGQAEPGKAVPVTARIALRGRFAIVTPGAPGVNVSRRIDDEDRRVALMELAQDAAPGLEGAILRSACADGDDNAIAGELRDLAVLAARIAGEDAGEGSERLLDGPGAHDRAWTEWQADGTGDFEALEVEAMIDRLESGTEPIGGGAMVHVDPTRALVAVDVDTGPETGQAAGLRANVEALRALPRVLRCRGLGGQIVVDCAPFPKRDRRQVEAAFRRAIRDDAGEMSLIGWTPLGHLELTRKRDRFPVFCPR